MRIISINTISECWTKHPQSEQPLKAWVDVAKHADWSCPQDVKNAFASASFVGDRVVFNIGGNKYRLVVGIDYRHKACFVKFVGTHTEYDDLDIRALR